jgi:hypothetical protein
MQNHLFLSPGDLTQFNAHAVAYSASSYLGPDGSLYSAFRSNVPGFAEWYRALGRECARNCCIGDTFWMPLAGDSRPHGVVVVVSTGAGDVANKPGTAVRQAFGRAVKELRARGRKERLLIALPAFRVGMGGDRSQRLDSARRQVAAALDVLRDHDRQGIRADIVFVPYTPTLYHIFLEARRELLGPPPDDEVRYPELESALLSGECVLFAGAGLSHGAGLPDWSELIRRLAHDLGVHSEKLDYLDLAQWYRERFGGAALADVVRDTFHPETQRAKPTLAHYLLLSLPVHPVITTNYDHLLEQTLTALKRHPRRVVDQRDVARAGRGDGVCVVKLHGDAGSAEAVVLSRDDYDEFFERRPALALLLEGLLLTQTFFFVGYGLRDPNFRQLYSRIARMLREARRPAYAVTFEASGDAGPYLDAQWRNKQLHLIPIAGADAEEKEQRFLRFLDRLAEEVTLRRPGLFLAPDADAPAELAALRGLLADHVGGELERLTDGELSTPQVRYLAEVLTFLAAHGWRPRPYGGRDLCRLWEQLAAHAADAAARRRMLIAALDCAEAFVDVERIRKQLAELRD